MSLRKALIPLLSFMLAAVPFFSAYSNSANAATSRVAVIKSLTGTVQVKKSGGSKQFKAFAKMSLNEGDVLTTSANSTAVLQFANGTSEDDKMTVSAKTTLTFSKLSDRSGTRTKVSMFNGSAWVDVKSIASKNDEFTLETPTAVMGVRGTHLLVNVDPATGATKLTVAAGVVTTQPTGSSETHDVKPGDNALITKDNEDNGDITVAPADLELLMRQSDKSIVEAIMAASGDIVKENQEKLDDYFNESETEQPGDLTRQKSNVENLLGAIVDQAVKNGLISKERVDQLVAEAAAATGVVIDLSKKDITLSDEQKSRLAEQKRKEEESLKLAEEKRKAAIEERKKNEELNKKLEADRKSKEEANRLADEEKKRKAAEEYQRQLDAAAKQRFEAAQKQREEEDRKAQQAAASTSTATSSPSTSPSPSPSATTGNGTPNPPALRLDGLTLTYNGYKNGVYGTYPLDGFVFNPNGESSAVVSANISSITLFPSAPSGLQVTVSLGTVGNPIVPHGTYGAYLPLEFGINEIKISVYASTSPSVKKEYVLKVVRKSTPDLLKSWTSKFVPKSAEVPPPSAESFEWTYVGNNTFAYQTTNLIQALTVDFEYDNTDYALSNATYLQFVGNTATPISKITYTDDNDGNVAMRAAELPSGYGLIRIDFNRKPAANSALPSSQSLWLWVLNGVTAPDWDEEVSNVIYSYDEGADEVLSLTEAESETGVPSLELSSKKNSLYITNYETASHGIRSHFIQNGSVPVTYVTYEGRKGWELLKADTTPNETPIKIGLTDRSGYFTHEYSFIVKWNAISPVKFNTNGWYETPNWMESDVTFQSSGKTDYSMSVPNVSSYVLIPSKLAADINVNSVKFGIDTDGGLYWQDIDYSSHSGGYMVGLLYDNNQFKIGVMVNGVERTFYLGVDKKPAPSGLLNWEVSCGYNDEFEPCYSEWKATSGDSFRIVAAGDHNQLKLELDFETGVTGALVSHTGYSVGNHPVPPTYVPVNVSEDPYIFSLDNQYELFTVQLMNDSLPVGTPYKLFVIDDDQLLPEEPFNLLDSQSSPQPIDYDLELISEADDIEYGFAQVEENINSFKIHMNSETLLSPFQAIDSNGVAHHAVSGKINDIPLNVGKNDVLVYMKDPSGATKYYYLTVYRYNLPSGLESWEAMTNLEGGDIPRWVPAIIPGNSTKRYYMEVEGWADFLTLYFTAQSEQTLELLDPNGELLKAFTHSGSDYYQFDLDHDGYYRFTLVNGEDVTELVIRRGTAAGPDETDILADQATTPDFEETIPTYGNEPESPYSNSFAFYTANTTMPVNLKLDFDQGDIEIVGEGFTVAKQTGTYLQDGIEKTGIYYTLSGMSPNQAYDVHINVYDPLDHSLEKTYLLTVYYGADSLPETLDVAALNVDYSGPVNSIRTVSSVTYQVYLSAGYNSVKIGPVFANPDNEGLLIISYADNNGLSMSSPTDGQITITGVNTLSATVPKVIWLLIQDPNEPYRRILYTIELYRLSPPV